MVVGPESPATIISVISILLSLVWITLSIRLYIRLVIARSFGWDDFFIVVTAFHVSLCGIAACVALKFGLTKHINTLTPDQIRGFLICFYCLGAGYVGSAGYVKISLLFQYKRVFQKGTLPYRLVQGMLVFMGLWTFGFVFTNWFACFPTPANFWNGSGKGCYGSFSSNFSIRNRFVEAHSSVNTIQDFMILCLGFYLFTVKDKDGLPLNRKGLSAVLAMGAVASGFSVWRLSDTVILFNGPGVADITQNVAGIFLNSTVEVSIGCLCATTPFFWPLIQTGLDMIFVKYEFAVSSESRWHDDHIELNSIAPKSETKLGGKPGQHYEDDYVHDQTDPFGGDFRTESTIRTGNGTAKPKNTVQFREEQV